MNKKIVTQYLLLTFCIALLFWGGMLLLRLFGITMDEHFWIGILLVLGGWSPTIASYVVLKRNGVVSGFKEWLKNVFCVKSKVFNYLFVIIMVGIYVGTQTIVSGSAMTGFPAVYMFFIGLATSFFMGGLEEAGWRYILQPGLDKRWGYIISSVVTGIIWFVWHIPLLAIGFIQSNPWMYAVNLVGMTFFYGAIIRISGKSGVFLSVLAHTLLNMAMNGFPFHATWAGTVITFFVMVIISSTTVFVFDRKATNHVV